MIFMCVGVQLTIKIREYEYCRLDLAVEQQVGEWGTAGSGVETAFAAKLPPRFQKKGSIRTCSKKLQSYSKKVPPSNWVSRDHFVTAVLVIPKFHVKKEQLIEGALKNFASPNSLITPPPSSAF